MHRMTVSRFIQDRVSVGSTAVIHDTGGISLLFEKSIEKEAAFDGVKLL